MKARELYHEVQEDEDLPIIAARYGIKDWQLVYDHEKNADLRKARPDPHVLYKGDQVWIPNLDPKKFDVAVNQTHQFVLYAPKTVLQLFLRDDEGNPYGDVKYEIWIDGARYGSGEQKTRSDGLIFEAIPVVKEVELRVWFPVPVEEEEEEDEDEIEEGDAELEGDDLEDWWDELQFPDEELAVNDERYESFILKVAHLDPLNTPEGLQERLSNLGYDCGEHAGEVDEKTREAIRAFQEEHGLPATGEVDFSEDAEDATLEALAKLFEEPEASA